MGTITKKTAYDRAMNGAPYGDLTALAYRMQTNASGVLTGGDITTAVADGDVIRLGKIPAGTKLLDSVVTISDAFTATSTYKMGFQYVDGVDVTAVPQSDVYFTAASTSLASVAVQRKSTTTAPITLPKDAYLILTNAVAQTAAGILDVVITGQVVGIEA
jgi:hypothetical protein